MNMGFVGQLDNRLTMMDLTPRSKESCPEIGMGTGKSIPTPLPERDGYIVEFEDKIDPMHSHNWPRSTKLFTSFLVCSGTFVVSYTSAAFSPAITAARLHFHVDSEIITLATALFIMGFAAGPILWAPLSELYGRKWPLTFAMLLGAIFTIASATANDIQTLIICRFFAGMCGAGHLSVVPGVLSDLFNHKTRGIAICYYALTVFVGPFCAPSASGFVVTSRLGWRWTLYIPAILAFINGLVSIFWLRETYASCILLQKAAILREQTGIWGIHAACEYVEVDIRHLIEKYFSRPIRMLVSEPIILLVSMYMSFIYGLVYCLLQAYPVVFEGIHGMKPGIAGLPFLGLVIGQVVGVAFVLSQNSSYLKKLEGNGNTPVPEWRLNAPMIGAPIFAIGIFWFGWTGYAAQIHWAVPSAAGIFIGFGTLTVFMPCFNYLVDAYLPLAASTVAANVMLRSTVAAGFPLFSKQMFEGMGVQWACTLLGCLAAIMIPVPFVFYRHGIRLRAKSSILSEI